MTTEKKPEKKAEKKSLSETEVVVSRKNRGGSMGTVGATAPGASKILDPGAKRGGASDADS